MREFGRVRGGKYWKGAKEAPVFKPLYFVRGFPGHPLHPPLTDGAIGAYTAAVVLGCLGAVGIAENELAKGWWLALLVGLGFGGLAALTGLVDWVTISWGTPLWRTATFHMLVMVIATLLFVLAAITGYDAYGDGDINGLALGLALVGYVFLTLGGWLGGSIVFVHGMRVLNLVDQPTTKAVTPGQAEKELAEEG
jgi:uncharacterized membrane protein